MRAPSQSVIQARLNMALESARQQGLTVYGYRIGEQGQVHVITNEISAAKADEADKWLSAN